MSESIPQPEANEKMTTYFGHMDGVLRTLMAVERYLHASDLAKCQLNHYEEVMFSPLTQDVKQQVERIKGMIGEFLLQRYTGDEPQPTVEEELEDLPENPLGSNPLGSKVPVGKTVFSSSRVSAVPVDTDEEPWELESPEY